MRCFSLPTRYNDPQSEDPGEERKLTIPLAVVCEQRDMAYVIVDHSRLFTMHIITNDRPWTQEDLTPGSNVRPFS